MIDQCGVIACVNSGKRYDAGQKLDFLRANIEIALTHPELGEDFRALLTTIVKEQGIA